MTTLRMPDLGTVEGTVTLVRWLKAVGEAVALGEPLLEVETDKGVSQVECAAEGVLVERVAAEGATLAAGEPIAFIRGAAESPPSPSPAAAEAPARSGGATAVSVPARSVPAPETRTAVTPGHGTARSLLALARKRGVDLATVRGTGPGGARTRQDILRAPVTPSDAAGAAPSTLGARQSVVAARMSQSHREKPVFHVTSRVDMGRVLAIRAGLSVDAFVVKACATAIGQFPAFRRYLAGQEVRTHEAVDVALAIAVEEDLFAPAVREAAARSVEEISAEIGRLASRARARTLEGADSTGSCFLVSNLGMFPVDSFDAVILPEHSAALAVGAAGPTPVASGQEVKIAALAAFTLSVDHRLINGAAAARFLARVKQLLEEGWE